MTASTRDEAVFEAIRAVVAPVVAMGERAVAARIYNAVVQAGMQPPQRESKHPEATCERCGRPNRSWVVDSDRFNAAMRGLARTRSAVVCPTCFMEGHQSDTGLSCSWELVPATPFRPCEASDV